MQSSLMRSSAMLPNKSTVHAAKFGIACPKTLVARRCNTASNDRTVPRRKVTTMGLPLVPIALVGYGFGAFKTTFEADKKAQLTALWPFLFVASESFRANFKRALSD